MGGPSYVAIKSFGFGCWFRVNKDGDKVGEKMAEAEAVRRARDGRKPLLKQNGGLHPLSHPDAPPPPHLAAALPDLVDRVDARELSEFMAATTKSLGQMTKLIESLGHTEVHAVPAPKHKWWRF